MIQSKAPSVADEMAKFSGFTVNNGETVATGKENKAGAAVDLSEEEIKAGARLADGAAQKTAPAAAAAKTAKVELTDEESETALEAARSKLNEGEELTTDEEGEVLAAALVEKRAAAKPDANSRVKRAQEGRRRAEARAARAESKLSDLERRMAAIEGGQAPLTAGAKPATGDAPKEPDPKDFELGELDPKYIRALVRWENQQEAAERTQNQKTQQRTSEQERAVAEFEEKKAAFEDTGLEAYDDFQEVVMDTVGLPKSDPAAWPLSATLGKLILDSEEGPHVAYLLASDPKEARRLDKLPAAAQMRWFFQQEAKFSGEKPANDTDGGNQASQSERQQAQQPRQVSKAPPPPQRSKGGSGNRQVSAATQDFAAFEALANQQPARR